MKASESEWEITERGREANEDSIKYGINTHYPDYNFPTNAFASTACVNRSHRRLAATTS